MTATSLSLLKGGALSCSSSRFLEVSNPKKGSASHVIGQHKSRSIPFRVCTVCGKTTLQDDPCIPEGPFMNQT